MAKFEKGQSGNPMGRKPGTGYRQQLFKSLVEPHKQNLFDVAIKMALEGNEAMLRLFLERMLPAKPQDDAINISLPNIPLTDPKAIVSYGNEILSSISNKEITPEEGKSLLNILESQRKNIETYQLATRIKEIEKILKPRKIGEKNVNKN